MGARAGFGDDLLSMIVAEHSRPLPPETTDEDLERHDFFKEMKKREF